MVDNNSIQPSTLGLELLRSPSSTAPWPTPYRSPSASPPFYGFRSTTPLPSQQQPTMLGPLLKETGAPQGASPDHRPSRSEDTSDSTDSRPPPAHQRTSLATLATEYSPLRSPPSPLDFSRTRPQFNSALDGRPSVASAALPSDPQPGSSNRMFQEPVMPSSVSPDVTPTAPRSSPALVVQPLPRLPVPTQDTSLPLQDSAFAVTAPPYTGRPLDRPLFSPPFDHSTTGWPFSALPSPWSTAPPMGLSSLIPWLLHIGLQQVFHPNLRPSIPGNPPVSATPEETPPRTDRPATLGPTPVETTDRSTSPLAPLSPTPTLTMPVLYRAPPLAASSQRLASSTAHSSAPRVYQPELDLFRSLLLQLDADLTPQLFDRIIDRRVLSAIIHVHGDSTHPKAVKSAQRLIDQRLYLPEDAECKFPPHPHRDRRRRHLPRRTLKVISGVPVTSAQPCPVHRP